MVGVEMRTPCLTLLFKILDVFLLSVNPPLHHRCGKPSFTVWTTFGTILYVRESLQKTYAIQFDANVQE